MANGYIRDATCSFKVKINLNRDGNICQPGEMVAGSKNLTFGGFASSIPASEALNDENSSALHNGVAGLIWLLSDTDENFDTMITRTVTEEVEDVAGRERVQVDQIPGEYRRMYENKEIKKILEENASRSGKRGGFSNAKLSISNNDNSSEGFTSKIKNFFTGTKQKNTREKTSERFSKV